MRKSDRANDVLSIGVIIPSLVRMWQQQLLFCYTCCQRAQHEQLHPLPLQNEEHNIKETLQRCAALLTLLPPAKDVAIVRH
jgi:hypothetical protein